MSKTRAEIADLKAQWKADPCWDIEETEGFEVHHLELFQYRKAIEADAIFERHAQLRHKAEQIGCPGNVALAEYVEGLEARILRLEGKVWEER